MKTSLAVAGLAFVLTSASQAADLKSELMAVEKASWLAWYKADVSTFDEGMTDDALMIFSDGSRAVGRKEILDLVATRKCTVKTLTFHDELVRPMGAEAALVTYTVQQDVTCGDGKQPTKVVGTAAYVRRDGRWRWVGYHETAASP
jgi:uncharacterized protein (TIGR02246 family)